MNHVTFIVPTIGRDTLKRALESLVAQTDPDWNCAVVADGIRDFQAPVNDPRIFTFSYSKGRCWDYGGMARNIGMAFDAGEWFAFLDDDDSLDPHYVEWLKAQGDVFDLVVFRMRFPDASIVPPLTTTQPGQLVHGMTGISFAVRASFQKAHRIQFITDRSEDWYFVENSMRLGARVNVSERVAYRIRA